MQLCRLVFSYCNVFIQPVIIVVIIKTMRVVFISQLFGDKIPPKILSKMLINYTLNTKFYPPNLLVSPILLSWMNTDFKYVASQSNELSLHTTITSRKQILYSQLQYNNKILTPAQRDSAICISANVYILYTHASLQLTMYCNFC